MLLGWLACAGANVHAQAAEFPPPAALEAYFCNYNPGKNRGDLDAATKFYVQQAEKAGITPVPAYLWTHSKGPAPADVVWLGVHENLHALAAADDRDNASAEMAAVNARYASVASCQANIGLATGIIEPEADENAAEDAVVATYACRYREGAGPAALPDLTDHIAGVNAGLGDAELDSAYQIVPLTGDMQGPEVIFVAVADDAAAWADNLNALYTTPDGQALVRHFNAVVDCSLNLWRSEQVVGGLD